MDAARDLETDVLVVGAGPTGLMLANRLAASGIRVVVIDGKTGPTRESRAIVLQARTLELYDQLGIADAVLAEARTAGLLAPGFGRRRFGTLPVGELGRTVSPFPRLYVLEQSKTERILYDNLRRLGGEVLWAHPLLSVEGGADAAPVVASAGGADVAIAGGADVAIAGGADVASVAPARAGTDAASVAPARAGTDAASVVSIAGGADVASVVTARAGTHAASVVPIAGGADGASVVTARAGTDAAPLTIRARYCVGADGTGSAVRRHLGIPFDGVTNDQTFYVCDATAVDGIEDDAINVRLGDEDFLLTFPMAGDRHHRLIGTVPGTEPATATAPATTTGSEPATTTTTTTTTETEPATTTATAPATETATATEPAPATAPASASAPAPAPATDHRIAEPVVRDRLARTNGITWGESTWFSTYHVHHRVAAAFRSGAFFLAGDAAHVHSPVGGQGMNTGIQDAHNLALKLVDVLTGRASDGYLDRYEAERRPVALRLVSTTDRIFGIATSSARRARMLRRAIAPALAPVFIRIAPLLRSSSRLFGYVSQTRIHYWMSDEQKTDAGGRRDPVVGRRLAWTGGNFDVLRSASWQVHSYGGIDPADRRRLRTELGLPVHPFPISRRTKLEAGTFYLVRPDGFVAAKAAPDVAIATFRATMPCAPPGSRPQPR